jgi:uncharacterized protein YndB with AHSA1/START domain
VTITFSAEGPGTRVQVRHTGWEKLGDDMEEAVASYDMGWDTVMGLYADAADPR